MTPQELLLEVFCLVDDELQALDLQNVRQRGPAPTLTDSEVITIELVGELLGFDQEAKLFQHFRCYHSAEFPGLRQITRSTFVRQAANLWVVKHRLHQDVAGKLSTPGEPWLVDSFPLPICRFARAKGCRLLPEWAAFGYDPVARQTMYGFRIHLRTSWDGVVLDFEIAPANAADIRLVAELLPEPIGVGIGDRAYWSPETQTAIADAGGCLLAPYKQAAKDPHPEQSRQWTRIRRRMETTIGQLTERFHSQRTKARDLWHLCHRVIRKMLSHTVAVLLNFRQGNPPLQLEKLLAA
jgi:hypothetical protein